MAAYRLWQKTQSHRSLELMGHRGKFKSKRAGFGCQVVIIINNIKKEETVGGTESLAYFYSSDESLSPTQLDWEVRFLNHSEKNETNLMV